MREGKKKSRRQLHGEEETTHVSPCTFTRDLYDMENTQTQNRGTIDQRIGVVIETQDASNDVSPRLYILEDTDHDKGNDREIFISYQEDVYLPIRPRYRHMIRDIDCSENKL